MDDIEEYRRRHREAYLKRISSDSQDNFNSNSSSGPNNENTASSSGGGEGERGRGGDGDVEYLGRSEVTEQDKLDRKASELIEDLFKDDDEMKQVLKEGGFDRLFPPSQNLAPGGASNFNKGDDPGFLWDGGSGNKKREREYEPFDDVRRPDDSYRECLLSGPDMHRNDDASDLDLQAAIAKSLIDM